MFQETSGAVRIALQQYSWLEKNKRYLKRQAEKTGSSASKTVKAVVTALENKNKYLLTQPKADIKKGSGGISVFHWVRPAEGESSACLSLSQVNRVSWL